MEVFVAAIALILLIKFGWALIMFCLTNWVAAILIFAAIIAFLA